MSGTVIVIVAGFVIGMMVGIFIGWSAAPAVVWRAGKDLPQPLPTPDAVGMAGGLRRPIT
jgi:uncharacterized membrane protein